VVQDGHPPLGWYDTVAYLVLPVLLIASQYVSMEIMKPPQVRNKHKFLLFFLLLKQFDMIVLKPNLISFVRLMILHRRIRFLFSSFFHSWSVTLHCLSHQDYLFTGWFPSPWNFSSNCFIHALDLLIKWSI